MGTRSSYAFGWRSHIAPLQQRLLCGVFFAALLGVAAAVASDEGASRVQTLTPTNFDEVIDGSAPALVEFYTPSCESCKTLAPIYEQLARSYAHAEDKVTIATVDADAHRELGRRFNVKSFPTLKWFDKGRPSDPTDYTSGRDLQTLTSFIEAKTGLASGTDGMDRTETTTKLDEKTGRIPELDSLAQKFAEATSEESRHQLFNQAEQLVLGWFPIEAIKKAGGYASDMIAEGKNRGKHGAYVAFDQVNESAHDAAGKAAERAKIIGHEAIDTTTEICEGTKQHAQDTTGAIVTNAHSAARCASKSADYVRTGAMENAQNVEGLVSDQLADVERKASEIYDDASGKVRYVAEVGSDAAAKAGREAAKLYGSTKESAKAGSRHVTNAVSEHARKADHEAGKMYANVKENIQSAAGHASEAVGIVGESVGRAASGVYETAKDASNSAAGLVADRAADAKKGVQETKEAASASVREAMQQAGGAVHKAVDEADQTGKTAGKAAESTYQKIKKSTAAAGAAVIDRIMGVETSAKQMTADATDKAKAVLHNAADSLSESQENARRQVWKTADEAKLKLAQYYITVMEKGKDLEDYVSGETVRLRNMIRSEAVTPEKLEEFQMRQNILGAFRKSKPGDVRTEVESNAGVPRDEL